MNATEERLRSGLLELAAGVRTGAAPAVIDIVRRQRRQKRLRHAIAGTAATVLAAMVAWFAVAPRPVTVQPAPLATPTVAVDSVMQYFGFDAGDPLVRHTVGVAMTRRGPHWSIRVTDTPQARQAGSAHDLEAPIGDYFAAAVGGRLAIVIVPDTVRGVQFGRGWGWELQYRVIKDAGLSLAVAWRHDTGSPEPDLIWLGSDDRVRVDDGAPVPSVRMDLDDATIRVFRDAGQDAWGYFTDETTTRMALPPPTAHPEGAEVRVLGPGDDRRSIGMLPAGASRVTVTPAEPATWTTASMPDGTTWFFVRTVRGYTSDSSRNRLVTSVGYTSASGERVSYVPRLP